MNEPHLSPEPAAPEESLESLARRLCRRFCDPLRREEDRIGEETLQDLLALAIHSYFERLESRRPNEGSPPPIRLEAGVTPTEAVVLVTELLKAVDVEIFELGMWKAFGKS